MTWPSLFLVFSPFLCRFNITFRKCLVDPEIASYLYFNSFHFFLNPHLRTLKKKDFALFLERGEGGIKRGRETAIGCLLHAPNWGPDPQHRHVSWRGMEPVIFRFTGQHSVHWATPARGGFFIFIFIFWLLEWVEGREQNINAREKHWLVASCLYVPRPGIDRTWPGDRTAT